MLKGALKKKLPIQNFIYNQIFFRNEGKINIFPSKENLKESLLTVLHNKTILKVVSQAARTWYWS